LPARLHLPHYRLFSRRRRGTSVSRTALEGLACAVIYRRALLPPNHPHGFWDLGRDAAPRCVRATVRGRTFRNRRCCLYACGLPHSFFLPLREKVLSFSTYAVTSCGRRTRAWTNIRLAAKNSTQDAAPGGFALPTTCLSSYSHMHRRWHGGAGAAAMPLAAGSVLNRRWRSAALLCHAHRIVIATLAEDSNLLPTCLLSPVPAEEARLYFAFGDAAHTQRTPFCSSCQRGSLPAALLCLWMAGAILTCGLAASKASPTAMPPATPTFTHWPFLAFPATPVCGFTCHLATVHASSHAALPRARGQRASCHHLGVLLRVKATCFVATLVTLRV